MVTDKASEFGMFNLPTCSESSLVESHVVKSGHVGGLLHHLLMFQAEVLRSCGRKLLFNVKRHQLAKLLVYLLHFHDL